MVVWQPPFKRRRSAVHVVVDRRLKRVGAAQGQSVHAEKTGRQRGDGEVAAAVGEPMPFLGAFTF